MKYNLSVDIEETGKNGYIHVKIDNNLFKWYWEFATGKYLAFVTVPTPSEWDQLFHQEQYERIEVLSEVAKMICKQKCVNCTHEIFFNSIGIMHDNQDS